MAVVTTTLLYTIFGLGALLTGRVSCQAGSSSASNNVLYYKVMTSQWLQDHASLNNLLTATPEALTFKVVQQYARIIKVPLFQKGELPTDDIVVTITVHLDDPLTADSDFLPGICDGTLCNAIFISDSGNYPDNACNYVTMNSGLTYTNAQDVGGCGAPITYQYFPNTAKLTFYPVNKWGSFSIPPSGGYTTARIFTGQIDITKGLYLEVYGHGVDEQYKLMFMEVKVTKNI